MFQRIPPSRSQRGTSTQPPSRSGGRPTPGSPTVSPGSTLSLRGLLPSFRDVMQLTGKLAKPALYLAGLAQVGRVPEKPAFDSALAGVVEAGFNSGNVTNVFLATNPFSDVRAGDDCAGLNEIVESAWTGPKGQPTAFQLIVKSDPGFHDDGIEIPCVEGGQALTDTFNRVGRQRSVDSYLDDTKHHVWRKILDASGPRTIVQMDATRALSESCSNSGTRLEMSFPWTHVTGAPNLPSGTKPAPRPICGGFYSAMKVAPTMLVMGRQLWTTGILPSILNLELASRHLVKAGYVVITVTHPGTQGFVVIAEPSVRFSGALEQLGREFGGQIDIQWPQPDSQLRFGKNHPRRPLQEQSDETQPRHEQAIPAIMALAPLALTGVVVAGAALALREPGETVPAEDDTPDTDSKGTATSRRSRLREHAGLTGSDPTEQHEITEPLPRDSKEALHTADALLKGQTWKVQREEWPKLARHIGEALVEGLPTIAVAILWSAYNNSARDLQELFADKAVDGPALRSIRRSLELSHELHTDSGILLDIQAAMERLDTVILILNSADKEPDKDEKGNTRQDTKDGKQGTDEAPRGDAEVPRRSAWPFMPPSQTVAHKNAYDAYHHFKREAGRGRIAAELRETRKEMAVPAFGTYPHLHFGQFGMVYSEKPEGGRPVIFGKGDEFNPAIFDRVYASLPDDERGAEIRRVLDNVAGNGGAG